MIVDEGATIVPTGIMGLDILRKDPLHRVPGCWYVAGSRMLRDLDERTVESLASRSSMATFSAGEFLHEAGEPMSAVTFISSGRVKVFRASRQGKQQTIALLGPGDAFGEIGVVDLGAQDLYVEALEKTVVCRATRDAFLQVCSRDPALAIRLAEAMGEKLHEAREIDIGCSRHAHCGSDALPRAAPIDPATGSSAARSTGSGHMSRREPEEERPCSLDPGTD